MGERGTKGVVYSFFEITGGMVMGEEEKKDEGEELLQMDIEKMSREEAIEELKKMRSQGTRVSKERVKKKGKGKGKKKKKEVDYEKFEEVKVEL